MLFVLPYEDSAVVDDSGLEEIFAFGAQLAEVAHNLTWVVHDDVFGGVARTLDDVATEVDFWN